MSEELKCCPFCGHKPFFADAESGYLISCGNCYHAHVDFAEKEDSINIWNTRAEQPTREDFKQVIKALITASPSHLRWVEKNWKDYL